MSALLAVADVIVHAALLTVLVGCVLFSAVLIHEQVSLIRKSLTTTKEHDQS